MDLKENLEIIFSRLENMFTAKTVVGEPLTVGEVTLVPVVNVSFGIGAGGGEGRHFTEHGGGGGGAGTGARLTPSAIVVIKGSEVSLLPLGARSNIDSIIDKVPDILGQIKEAILVDDSQELGDSSTSTNRNLESEEKDCDI